MANEEIEISELEFTEELASDNLIPVESSTDTKATSLQAIKNWLSSFFVGKKGDETIDGVKTFTSGHVFKNSATLNWFSSLDLSIAPPTTASFGQLNFYDRNNSLAGGFHLYQFNNGRSRAGMRVRTGEGAEKVLCVYNDGTTTCPASSVENSIVTTTGIAKSPNGFVKLGNGVILQWGSATPSSGSGTITFPTPFAGMSRVVTGVAGALSEPRVVRVFNNSKTSFDYECYKQNGDKASQLATAFFWFAIGY